MAIKSTQILLAFGMMMAYPLAPGQPGDQVSERIVFFGDSITQNGLYISYVDTLLRIRLPDRHWELINHGISSETVSGTSEPDHDPRRPDAHDRFDRDVLAWKPDRVFACFGMNDGNYFPPDEERFTAFREGVERLVQRTKAIPSRLVLLTPPPYDPYRRQVGDENAVRFGYKFPALNYDETLRRFAEWERTLADEPNLRVIDLHSRLNKHLSNRRSEQVSYFLAGDGVHPGETGHLLMALAVIEAFEPSPIWAEAEVDASQMKGLRGEVNDVRFDGDTLRFQWTRALPLPRAKGWDGQSLAQENVPGVLGRERLVASHLPEGRYELTLSAEGQTWKGDRELTSVELAEGLDLDAWWPALPLQKRADALLAAVVEARQRLYDAWRRSIERGPGDPASPGDVSPKDEARLRKLAEPGRVDVRIRRIGP